MHTANNKPGDRLKWFRERLGLTLRQVADLSHIVAADQGSNQFLISHPWLVQIENGESAPSVHKLLTLSAIYGVPLSELINAYINVEAAARLHLGMQFPGTHPAVIENSQEKRLTSPLKFKPCATLRETTLLSRLIEEWAELPVGLLEYLNVRKHRYALIGLSDFTMYPLLRPGSFVQIDECKRVVSSTECYHSEFERPIYFIELRSGFLCSWCEVRNGSLVSIPHPLSYCRTRVFAFPAEAEVIGCVTGVAVKLINKPASRQGNPFRNENEMEAPRQN